MFSPPENQSNAPNTPEPAVIIGVGKVGSEILAELRARWKLHREFQTPNVDSFEQVVEYVDLFEPFEEELSALSAVKVRQWFLKDENLVEVAHKIKAAYNRVRFHSQQPLVTFIEPKLFLIGTTWEPIGSALLWPLAELIQRILDENTRHYLIGIFLSANYNEGQDEQEEGDAHTFVTLKEGDATLNENLRFTWQEKITHLFPQQTTTNKKDLYDHLFLLDSLKANNATVETRNDDWELRIHVSALLEGLVYTPLYRLLDSALLDDYLPQQQQVYIGAGTSTLRVPLEEILQIVRDYAVGSVIQERLFPSAEAEQIAEIHDQATDLTSSLIRELKTDSQQRIERYFEEKAAKGIDLGTDNQFLEYRLMAGSGTDQHYPAIPPIEVRGADPFSGERSLQVDAVLGSLRAEVSSRQIILDDIKDLLEARQDIIQELTAKTYGEAVENLLKQGDQGLWQAEELLCVASKKFSTYAQKLRGRAGEIEKSRRFRQVLDSVEGMSRWNYDTRVLRPAIAFKPRVQALVVRSALLVILLFQFYWSGIYRDILFWPLDVLNFQLLQELAGPAWEWLFVIILWMPMLVLILFLAGIPALALRSALRSHRSSLAALLQLELTQIALNIGANQLEQIAEQKQNKCTWLESIQIGLRNHAESFLHENGDRLGSDTYLEYLAVTPQGIANFQQQREEVTKLTLDHHMKKFIESWRQVKVVRQDKTMINGKEEVDVEDQTIPESAIVDVIIEFLQYEVRPEVHRMVIKPVEAYLNPDEHQLWFQRLWHSSVPWLKDIHVSSSTRDELIEPPLLFNAAIMHCGKQSGFAGVTEEESNQCHILSWFDPYRILLTRMHCGTLASRLARQGQLQQAFQLRPPRKRQLITQNEELFADYPALLPDQDELETTAESSERDTDHDAPLTETPLEQTELDGKGEKDVRANRLVRYRQELDEIVTGFEDAITEAPNLDPEIDVRGLGLLIQPARHYVDSVPRTIDKMQLIASLNQLDSVYPTNLEAKSQEILSEKVEKLDRFLDEYGIEPVAPPDEELYSPRDHGEAIDMECSDTIPVGHIVRVIQRGYRDKDNGSFIKVPKVIVSKGPCN